jgi:hypothetical protein
MLNRQQTKKSNKQKKKRILAWKTKNSKELKSQAKWRIEALKNEKVENLRIKKSKRC